MKSFKASLFASVPVLALGLLGGVGQGLAQTAPNVYIYSPTNNAKYLAPASLTLCARIYQTNGMVLAVQFFAGDTSLGVVVNTNTAGAPSGTNAPVFALPWSNVAAGSYALKAVATDASGLTGTSAVVNITVTNSPPPPVVRPSIYIFSPTNNAKYLAPASLTLYARAVETTGVVQTVEFFSGGASLGIVQNGSQVVVTNLSREPLFPLAWPNVAAGSYALTAIATDARGLTATSAVVNITVTNSPPPPVVRPTVYIYSPTNGAKYVAPATLTLLARAYESNGLVRSVQFFSGEASLGVATNANQPGTTNSSGEPVFSLVWPNVSAGAYALKAVATDAAGMTATSTVVNITVTNSPPPPVVRPYVYIYSPANGAKFAAPATLTLLARAYESNGIVRTVQFFAGDSSLGQAVNTNQTGLTNGNSEPLFSLVWPNVAAGAYALKAVATDAAGMTATSAIVNITVTEPLPTTNRPPEVRITSPPNAAQFRSPVNIPIYAYARDPDGLVTSVEFFAGGNTLGLGAAAATGANLDPTRYATNYFLLVWSNAPVGSFVLTARATDNSNAVTVSLPVSVAVLPPSPPVTNTVPTVSIVAIDPVAIEGTNCWVYAGASNSAANWTTWPDGTRLPVTNCGPKNATFAVQRSGDTNRALTVAYGLGGTASNGVDYLTLPGVVTIPAGQRQAMIAIVPLDDGPPDVNTTVIIKLGPADSYRLGSPASAEALIIDNVAPSPATTMLADKTFRLNASGPTGAWFRVDYSTDMLNWMPLCTNQVVNGSIDFVDPNATGNLARFYRVVPEANPPQ